MRTIVLATGLALGLAACGSKDTAPAGGPPLPTTPTQTLINAMGEYCRIGDLPREQQREAMKAWGWSAGGDKELGPLWHRAASLHEPAAIALIKKAAETAVGAGKCPILEALK